MKRLGLLFFAWSTLVLAEPELVVAPAEPLLIGIVDEELVIQSLAQDIREQVQVLLNKYHGEFVVYENALRQERQALHEAQNALTQGDEVAARGLARKQEAFERKALDIQKKADHRRQKLTQAHRDVIETLKGLLVDAIREVGKEKRISLMIQKSAAAYWQESLDVSDLVKAKLLKKIEGKKELLKVTVHD